MRVIEVPRAELALYALAVLAIVTGCGRTEVFTKHPPVDVPSVSVPAPTTTIGEPMMTSVPTRTVAATTRDPRPAAS